MVSGMLHIKINSDDENKDNGFYALMTSGASIVCVKDEEYLVPDEAIKRLNDKEIDYEVVPDKKGLGEASESGTKIEI